MASFSDVEHAGLPTSLAGLPGLQYEGFEPTGPNEDLGLDPQSTTDAAFTQDGLPSGMFELGRVQYTLPAPLVALDSSSNVLTLAFTNSTLRQLNLRQPDAVASITLPTPSKKPPTDPSSIHRVFMDPTGKHTLITTDQGENFYFYEGWTRAKPLWPKARFGIESVAWNEAPPTGKVPSTREILLGTSTGVIYEAVIEAQDSFKSPDRYIQPVYTLPDKQAVTGLKFEISAGSRVAVLATTSTRMYQFGGQLDKKGDGAGKLFDSLFDSYRSTVAPKVIDIPGQATRSELRFFTPQPKLKDSGPSYRNLAWLTGSGIYHGILPLPPSSEDMIDSPSLLQYPVSSLGSTTGDDPPISICITEFHFVLLFKDRICAINNIDERLVWEEALPLKPNEKALGLVSDPKYGTYWLYADTGLFELVVKDEDRDVWSVHLKREDFPEALRYAKTAPQRALVYTALARQQFNQGNYILAAQSYAQSSTAFEHVALDFIGLGDAGRDGLRTYLYARLERCSKSELTQRMLLATWLVEFYLSKINTLDDVIASERASHDVENLKTEQALLEDELRAFFDTYKGNLDKRTVYDLILSHGREEVFIYYATAIGDFERVLEHHIVDEAWLTAVDVLTRQSDLELFYRFSPVLMRTVPKELVDAWLRQPALDPIRLLPAVLQLQHRLDSETPQPSNHAIRYLQQAVFTSKNASPTIHNLLLTLLVTYVPGEAASPLVSPVIEVSSLADVAGRDVPLLKFLSGAPTDPVTGKPYYDLDYALRLCKQHDRMSACVHIYALMGMWEESVELALQIDDLDMAKINCERATEDVAATTASSEESLRKRLWLKVAKFVVQEKKDIKTAMKLLESTTTIKIEDILPFFPDFVVIDDFKEEICDALEGYSEHIQSLKAEMDEATKSAESIKADIKNLQNRFITLDASEKCSICGLPLLTRQFYVFPCQHTFHADCLIGQVKEYLPAPALRRLITLQNALVRMQPQSVPAPPANDRPNRPSTPPAPAPKAPQSQRTLLSAAFNPLDPTAMLINPAVRLASSLNPLNLNMPRNLFGVTGDRLRDLIVPDALANAIGGGVGRLPGMNMLWGAGGPTRDLDLKGDEATKSEKIRDELDELLAASCPLCEGVVVGLDKPFIALGELDNSWQL